MVFTMCAELPYFPVLAQSVLPSDPNKCVNVYVPLWLELITIKMKKDGQGNFKTS